MKTLLKVIMVIVLFASCSDVETAIYEGTENDQTFLSFSRGNYNLDVAVDSVGVLEVILNSSNVSSVDRTYSITVVAEESTADPATYDIPATVTIPAGSHQGKLVITGEDNDLVEVAGKPLVITFTPLNELEMLDSNRTVINVREVCPFSTEFFKGEYLIQSSGTNPFGVRAFETQVVNVEYSTPYSRTFDAIYSEAVGFGTVSTFPFDLLCGSVSLSNSVEITGLYCGAAIDPQTYLNVAPAIVPGSYNEDNDSNFTLRIREFPNNLGNCIGATPVETTITFTKQ